MTLTQNAETQSAMTPERALKLLSEGNRRFQEGRLLERDLGQQVRDTVEGQWPFAALLSCIDSRTSAELVFDAGIGDLFSTRVAGNCINEDVLGSLEFACKVAGARLVVVLGHSRCGAIKGACDDVRLGNLTALLAKLKPAVAAVAEPSDPARRNSSDEGFVEAVARKNVELVCAALRKRSAILRELEDEGAIRIVGAMYNLHSAAVEFLD